MGPRHHTADGFAGDDEGFGPKNSSAGEAASKSARHALNA
jgi:hypothetical protein